MTFSLPYDARKVEAWDYNPVSSLQGGYVSFTFKVHVTPTNDPPSITGPRGNILTGKEDSKIHLSGGGGIVLSDPDELRNDDDLVEVRITVGVGKIRLPLSHAGGLYLLNGEQPEGSSEFFARGGLDEVNRALQRLTYQAPANWNGADQVDVWVSDLGDGTGGDPLEAQLTFGVEIEAVGDVPKLRFPKTVHYLDEDTSLAIDFVTVSDADTDAILDVTVQPDHGVVEISPATLEEEVWMNVKITPSSSVSMQGKVQAGQGGLTLHGMAEDVDTALRMLAYRPVNNFAGQVAVSTRVTDETGLAADGDIYLYVRPMNDFPEIELPGDTQILETTAGDSGQAITGVVISDVDVADSSDICANIRGIAGRNALSLRLSPGFGFVSIIAERATGVWVVDAPTAGPGDTLLLRGSVGSLQTALDEGSVLYSAPYEASGRDKIVIAVDDGGNCGEGGIGSTNRTLEIDVAPYEPPLVVEFGTSAPSDSVLFTHEGERLILPDVVVSGGSVGERAAVEIVIIAASGNATLQQFNLKDVEILDGNGTTGERLRLRGSPAALSDALLGMSFEPRPYFFGCWDRNGSCTDDTPVRSSREQGALALARIDIVGTPDGDGTDVPSDHSSIKERASWSHTSLKISVGWINDPPTVNAPGSIVVTGEAVESLVPGIRVADPDAMDELEGRGRLDINVSTSMGGILAVDPVVGLKNGLRNIGVGEMQIRLRGQPEYVNNVLATLTWSNVNATNSTVYVDGERIDEILVDVSDLGFSGNGGEKRATASIMVHAGPPTTGSTLEYDVFALEKLLPLVTTNEGSAVALPGLEAALSSAGDADDVTVIVSSKEGYLSLGPHGEGVAAAAAREEWGPAVTLIETVGGAEQTLPEVQVSLFSAKRCPSRYFQWVLVSGERRVWVHQ